MFFQFSYYYNGIRLTQITGENGPSVTVGITDEKIMYLSADMLSVNAAADSTTAIMPIRAAMVILRAENASYSARGASLCYVLKQNGYMFSADWAFSKSDTENGRKVE
ncbi:hypothetical protein SDC9_105997 [bioreactor metagenome]|uniref:Uncharacterized protein n=1 Tax=bioreactor metagenome TaxID=1076179 RepID=A0A645B257_9ZZZZ